MTDLKAKGEFYFLAFGFQQYRTDEDGLVFRQGLAVTGESLGKGSILAQNFVLFNTDLIYVADGSFSLPISCNV